MTTVNLKTVHVAGNTFAKFVKLYSPLHRLVFYVDSEADTTTPGAEGFVDANVLQGDVDFLEPSQKGVD